MIAARLTVRPLVSAKQTAAEMVRLATQYKTDLGDKAKWPLPRFFNYVRKLPYRADPVENEWVSRPALSMSADWPHRDCDDKAILMGAWCACNGIPFCFVASSKRPDRQLHHVFTVAKFPNGRRVCLDATYPHHRLGEWPKNPTKVEELTGDIMPQLSTLEGELGFSLTKAVRKVGKVAKKAAKPSTYVKAARAGGHVVMEAKRAAVRLIGKAMPDVLERQVKKAVRAVVGNRTVTTQTKAIILPSATAAALAIPGVQAFAPAVPVVVNAALDEMISQAKSKFSTASKPAAKGIDKDAAKRAAMERARGRAAQLKEKISSMKAKAAAAPATAEEAEPEEAAPAWKRYALPGIIGLALVGAGVAALKGKRG